MPSKNRLVKEITSEEIITRMKADLKNPPNKIEGSFASDNIQAVGKELERYYNLLEYLDSQHYIETAEGDALDKKANDVGVFRKQPTKATGFVTFIGSNGTFIPAGLTVASDAFSYITTRSGRIEDGQCILPIEAVEPGSLSNIPAGSIYKFQSTPGIREVTNAKPISNGTDLETDANLRARTQMRVRYPGTSGNQHHYMHWAMEVEGVGRVKVFPLWDGPGTVKVSILDSNQQVANEDLIQKVQYHIDHEGERMGEALAPIGALLTVSTAKTVPLKVEGKINMVDDMYYTEDMIAETLKTALQLYIDENISYKTQRLTVAKVIDILYTLDGVLDIIELTVNDRSDSISFGPEEVPIVESVDIS